MNTLTALDDWKAANPLRKLRAASDASMLDTAAALNVGMSTMQAWEYGVRRPAPEKMSEIAAHFDVDAAKLTKQWEKWRSARPAGV